MNRRGFFRLLASAPAAAVVAPAAIAEAAPIVAGEMAKFSGIFGGRQVGKAAALAYGYGMNKYGTVNIDALANFRHNGLIHCTAKKANWVRDDASVATVPGSAVVEPPAPPKPQAAIRQDTRTRLC